MIRKLRYPGLIRTVLGLAVALGLGRAMWAAETPKSAALAAASATSNIGIHLLGLGLHDIDRIADVDLDYLQRKGVTLVRLDLSWEKLQPDLAEGLDRAQVDKLKAVLDALAARGIRAVIDMHQYGRYNPNWRQTLPAWARYPGQTVYGYTAYNPWVVPNRRDGVIGSPEVPVERFQAFWQALAQALGGHPALWGYDLVNEPVRMGGRQVWQAAAQAAIDGIRRVDKATPIVLEPYYGGDGPGDWPQLAFPEVRDPANRLVFSPHVYFDQNSSGYYNKGYADDAAYATRGVDRVLPAIRWARERQAQLFYGEFGTPPTDNDQWQELAENTLAYFKQHGVSATWCQYAVRLPGLNPDKLPPGAAGWWQIQNNRQPSPVFGIMIQPDDQGVERPQMAWLQRWLGEQRPDDRLVLSPLEAVDGRIPVPDAGASAAALHVVVAGDGKLAVALPFAQDAARRDDLTDRVRYTAKGSGQRVELFNVPAVRFQDGRSEDLGMAKGACTWPTPRPVTAEAGLCKTGTLRNLRHVTGGDGKPYWNWVCQGLQGGSPVACGTSG